jgi:signal transduction histidine kinase
MTTGNNASWPQVIRRHVLQLVLLVVIFGLIAVGYNAWSQSTSEKHRDQANNYHLASYSHYITAMEELRHAQNHMSLNLAKTCINSEVVTKAIDTQQDYNGAVSFYLINREIKAGLELQHNFSDARFDMLTDRLTHQFSTFEKYGRDCFLDNTPSDQAITVINDLLRPLSKLARLHSTVRIDLLSELKSREQRQIIVFYVLLSVLIFIGFLIARRSLLAIDRIINEIKLNEEALRRSQKMEAIGQLTGGIAHDFNNILGAILGNIELLELQTVADEKTKKRFDTIKHSIQRAVDLTKQLLGFSRTEVTGAKVTNINEVIMNMQNLIIRSLTPQVEVKHQLSEDLWLTEINPGDFEDAMLNLALNARDAMPDGGKLSIETCNRSLDASYCALNPGIVPGDYVELAVSDNGLGISLEDQERIFEPFFTTKPPGKGTGLGLAMVFGFVKRSGGNIKIYSEPGIGSTFRLYLPRAKGTEQPLDSGSAQATNMPRGKETILVVDDEISLLQMVEETLRAQGYTVLTATNGKQALEILAAEPVIDMLFSDVVMPGGINGYELAEQAVASRPQLKVLLTSGYTEMAVARNGQARFNATLLNKPYTLMNLTQRVRQMLD